MAFVKKYTFQFPLHLIIGKGRHNDGRKACKEWDSSSFIYWYSKIFFSKIWSKHNRETYFYFLIIMSNHLTKFDGCGWNWAQVTDLKLFLHSRPKWPWPFTCRPQNQFFLLNKDNHHMKFKGCWTKLKGIQAFEQKPFLHLLT